MNCCKMDSKDFELLVKLDYSIYPSNNVASKEKYSIFFEKNPEFGIAFKKGKKTIGLCVVIPFNKKGFFGFVNGKITENEIKKEHLFDNSRDKKIYLYILHIEKLFKIKNFYIHCLKELGRIVSNLKKQNCDLIVGGIAGLCVTNSGVSLFFNKFNCVESKFISNEYIFSKNNKRIIFNIHNKNDFFNKINSGFKFVNRSKMLVLLRETPSIVWNYL